MPAIAISFLCGYACWAMAGAATAASAPVTRSVVRVFFMPVLLMDGKR
jgi:hypothetical protein